MASQNGSSDLVEYGTLHVFLDLPDQSARDAFVAEALRAMQEAPQTLNQRAGFSNNRKGRPRAPTTPDRRAGKLPAARRRSPAWVAVVRES